jgi:hypothetical protein
VLVLMASFGVGLTPDQIAIAVVFMGSITTLVVTLRVTPANDPLPVTPASGVVPAA